LDFLSGRSDLVQVEDDVVPLPGVLRGELLGADLALKLLVLAALLHVEGHVGLVLVVAAADGAKKRAVT
jgi:hypothetical protein